MGFSEVNSKLKESTKTDFSDIISQKVKRVMIHVIPHHIGKGS